MSSQKTQEFQLHVWEPGDDFLRTEFNENFAKLDSQIQRIVTGSYTGDGSYHRVISLGFRPKAVLLNDWEGRMKDGYRGGLALDGCELSCIASQTIVMLEIVDNGFQLTCHNSGISNNSVGISYYYLAVKG